MTDGNKETVIFSCKPRFAASLPFVFAGTAVLAVCIPLGIWQFGAAAFGTLAICGCGGLVSGSVTVTDIRVICGKISVPIEEITEIECGQGFTGKLFHYGTVTILTSRKRLTLRGLPHTDILRSEISKQIDLYRFKQTCRQAELAREMME